MASLTDCILSLSIARAVNPLQDIVIEGGGGGSVLPHLNVGGELIYVLHLGYHASTFLSMSAEYAAKILEFCSYQFAGDENEEKLK